MERTVRIGRNVLGLLVVLYGGYILAEAGFLFYWLPEGDVLERIAAGCAVAITGLFLAMSGLTLIGRKPQSALHRWWFPVCFLTIIVLMWWSGGILLKPHILGDIFLLPFKGWLIGW